MIDGGLIEYFHLEEWYNTLTKEEKQKICEYYFAPVGLSISISDEPSNPQEDPSIIELGDPIKYINSFHPKLTKGNFLQKIGNNAINFGDHSFAEKVYSKAIETDNIDPITRHFIFNSLIDYYYRNRNEDPDALKKCIEYCKEDIKYLDDFLNAYTRDEEERKKRLKENSPNWENDPLLKQSLSQGVIYPRIPSVERLAIIYEKKGKIEEAIKICEIALKYELRDSTKGGFVKRKERLEKKLTKPKINVYEKEGKPSKIKKEKIKRPIIPYNQIDLKFDVNINFSVSNSLSIITNYVDYWNQFVNKLFNLINNLAQREIAFLGYRKNYPLPIVTTYQRCENNPISPTDIINLDLDVFTDDNCSKFVDDLYDLLKSINPTNEILSFEVKQPWLLSTSKEGINRTHYEIKCKIKK